MINNLERPSVIIFARLNSSRFPNKVLSKIGDIRMIDRVINRVKLARNVNKIILAIPDTKINDQLEEIAFHNNILLFRGSSEDVLSRIYQCCKAYDISSIIRINGDCPFIDPSLIDELILNHFSNDYDYTSNILEDSFPVGMHIEIIKKAAIFKANFQASLDIEREHVTPYIYNNPNIFKLNSVVSIKNNSDIRICIDYPEDLIMANKLVELTSDTILDIDNLVSVIRNNEDLYALCKRHNKKQAIFL
tara:strand:- start:561 stop:1304 length:744 start_codon:yes stop_codon:yes gene_type:complete